MRFTLFLAASILCVAVVHAAEDPALEAAKALHEKTNTKLDQDLETAKKKHTDGLAAAREKLLVAYDAAIKRATQKGELEAANALVAAKKNLQAGDAGEVKGAADAGAPDVAGNAEGVAIAKLDPKKWYRGFLGYYYRWEPKGTHPYVFLGVPNADLWTEGIQAKLRGKIDFQEISYEGQSALVIPKDGTYTIEFHDRTQAYLDGKQITAGDIELRKGIYRVKYNAGTHGGPYLPSAFIRATSKATGDPAVFAVKGADVRTFLGQRVNGLPVTELSGQNLVEVKVD